MRCHVILECWDLTIDPVCQPMYCMVKVNHVWQGTGCRGCAQRLIHIFIFISQYLIIVVHLRNVFLWHTWNTVMSCVYHVFSVFNINDVITQIFQYGLTVGMVSLIWTTRLIVNHMWSWHIWRVYVNAIIDWPVYVCVHVCAQDEKLPGVDINFPM